MIRRTMQLLLTLSVAVVAPAALAAGALAQFHSDVAPAELSVNANDTQKVQIKSWRNHH